MPNPDLYSLSNAVNLAYEPKFGYVILQVPNDSGHLFLRFTDKLETINAQSNSSGNSLLLSST